jgi:signal transduction histidine kinase/CheY-like chemotaxis protein/HPt (histidine-containing phosphotransfer) domain-containing protein
LSGVTIALFAAVAGLVVLVFVVLLVSVVNLRDDTRNGRRSTDLLIASYGAEVSLGEVSASLRGWLIDPTGGSGLIFKRSEATLATELGTLRLLASGASERGRVNTLTASVDRYLADYADPLVHPVPKITESSEVAAVRRGQRLLSSLTDQFAALDNIELASRQQRRSSLSSQTSRTIMIAAIGLAGSVLLLAVLGGYMLRGVLRPIRRVAEALDRRGKGDLSTRVSEEGRGEVAMLERSFNQMAEQLERRTMELSEANRRLEHAVAEAETASRMKSDFLANMSHEIRTPLNGVVGMVSLLSGTRLTDEQHEYVEMARSASGTLLGVVSDILDVSKIEAGMLELEHEDFGLHELIGVTRDILVQEASRKGLGLHVRIADDVPQVVRGDRLRVGQVLGNLLSNAIKFTPEGDVSLETTVAGHTNVATIVRFAVHDTGIGIAADRVESLFEPFIQADASTTRKFGGTGLGLTISRDLTRLMGGTISVRSEPEKGSTFEVSIPFAPAIGAVTEVRPSVELQGLRILIVDDNDANRLILERYVTACGMRATTAVDGDDAMSQLVGAAEDGEAFDVALLDFNMPGETGVELAQRINESPRLRGARLILLSSSDDTSVELKPNGIGRRLTKPVSRSDLLDAIEAAMHERLAAAAGASKPEPHAGAGAEPPAPRRRPARILIAEDNFVNRMYVERLLSRRGYDVTTVDDGRRVLEILEPGMFDLILMDCQMPELDGYDTTREIRRREAENGGVGRGGGSRIPVIAMTAAATDEIRDRCIEVGMDDYLSKPLGDLELDSALQRGLASVPERAGGLDRAKLAQLRELFDDDGPGSVLIRIRAEIDAALARARERADGHDAAGVAHESHAIRGSAEMIGATALVDAAAELERSAVADGAQLHDAVAAVASRWEETRPLLDAEVVADQARARLSSPNAVD